MACDPDRYAPCVIPDGPVILQGDEPTKWQVAHDTLASSGFNWTPFWIALFIIAVGACFVIWDRNRSKKCKHVDLKFTAFSMSKGVMTYWYKCLTCDEIVEVK